MPSRFMPTLEKLATEPDEDRRLEIAAEIDRDATDLDEKWGNRDAYSEIEVERDRLAAERDEALARADEWREKYTRRFFGETTPEQVKADNARDIRSEGRPRSFEELFTTREG